MYNIVRYSNSHYAEWNAFIENSKNGTFLFHRDFMEYHSDRFNDYSLLGYKDDKLIAVLPANCIDNTLYSHQGLTYGGLIYNSSMKLSGLIKIYNGLLRYLHNSNIEALHIKPVPRIYHKVPAEEQEYIFFLLNAELTRRDGLSVISLKNSLAYSKSRKEAIKRGRRNNLKIVEEANFELFWNELLLPNLLNKHSSKPVHTAEEMAYLQQKFPDKIKHYNVYHNNRIVAGTTMFVTDSVAHPQYVSGQEDKNTLGSLDYLYDFLISEFSDRDYFDFGPSTEEQGRKLKEGIIFWKESYGARTVIQDFYKIATQNFTLLDSVLI